MMSSPIVELLSAIRTHALQNALVVQMIDDRFYDGFPSGDVTYPFVSFGPVQSLADDAECIVGLDITVQIDVWSQYEGGKLEALNIVDRVKRALHNAEIELDDHALADIEVEFAQVIHDPDGQTSHGVIRVGALVEEN